MDRSPRTSVPGIGWPAMPDARGAMTLALAWQLEQSEWWTPDALAAAQHAQRDRVFAHAVATVPHYAGLRAWDDVPILTRDAAIAAGPRLMSTGYPTSHGATTEVSTSRSTGQPVRLRQTGVTTAMWHAITLRDHAWHGRDLGGSLAAIRHVDPDVHAGPPDGLRARGWTPATALFAPDAPVAVLSVATTTDQQLAWLARVDPTYLLVYPSVLDALVRRLKATGTRLPALRQIQTISEVLSPETRALATEVTGAPVIDTYSAQEVGYIALACPSHGGYHVQAERLLVEILDDAGAPCPVGATGRVIVTDLHNFATPLLRYELGDYATVGAPCGCGRGLPRLDRIVGRRRNLLTYPDGRTAWPVFTVAARAAARYRVCQLVQPARDALILRIAPDGPLDDGARAALIAAVQRAVGHPFAVTIELVDELARSPSGKLEEFVSLI